MQVSHQNGKQEDHILSLGKGSNMKKMHAEFVYPNRERREEQKKDVQGKPMYLRTVNFSQQCCFVQKTLEDYVANCLATDIFHSSAD